MAAGNTLVDGEYFKRYVPDNLRAKYEHKKPLFWNLSGGSRVIVAKAASAATLILAAVIVFYSLAKNLDIFLSPIDLSHEEIQKLDYTRHQWARSIDKKLPRLSDQLAAISDRGFILPGSLDDAQWLFKGRNIRRESIEQWSNFAKIHDFNKLNCEWERLPSCQKAHPNWFILALPGYWNLPALDTALRQGANVIVYGPPAQIDTNIGGLDWQGISFLKAETDKSDEIILRGDKLLTLNFDAGLIISALTTFNGYLVHANNAQAVLNDDSYEVEESRGTRLYAKAVGAGRLVWLDFPPDAMDHDSKVNVTHLNAVVASIFRFFSRKPYSSIATWPEGKPFAAIVDEDTEDEFANASLAAKLDYPISWYMLSNLALKNRDVARELSRHGEVACHGDHHGPFIESSSREQVIRIARCKKVLKAITGVEPKAFRPPEEKFNPATIDAIANNDMDHFIAVNSSDRSVPELRVSLTNGRSLISIPRSINDDYEMWHVRDLNYLDSVKLMDEEAAWSKYIGGVHMFSFHTQYIDVPDNLKALKHLCEKLVAHDAYFKTSQEISDWWRIRKKLVEGKEVSSASLKKYRPMLFSVNEKGELTRAPYVQIKNSS